MQNNEKALEAIKKNLEQEKAEKKKQQPAHPGITTPAPQKPNPFIITANNTL